MYIRTVLGNITPEELGITLGHEPLLIDLRGLWDNPPTIPSLWWLGRDHLLSNIVPR
jgi:predicted metal-dependent phosphotriesterase family hydrolase